MTRTVFIGAAAALALVTFAGRAHADGSAAAGGGLQAVTARVDVAQSKLRFGTCGAPPCTTSEEQSIALPSAIDDQNIRITTVEMAGGKRALWVHVPSRDVASWDAVLVGRSPAVVFAGATGKTHGQPGSMSGTLVKVIPDGAGHSYVARGSVSEDFSICEREALANAEVLDPQSLEWRGASFQQLTPTEIAHATAVDATARQAALEKPLAPLLSPRFASSGTRPNAIADGDPATAWSEAAAGPGRGQFVVFGAPSEVAISRLAITITPTTPAPNGAAPRAFFLASKDQLFTVTMPEDAWAHPGRAYDITLPQPIKSSCVALVLDDAYVQNTRTPDVSIAEIAAYSELDVPGATLESIAVDLGAGGRRATIAEAVLKRAGDAALGPIASVWPKLDVAGHERALDAAEGAPCGAEATRVFLNGLCEGDAHVAHKAEIALQHCRRDANIVAAIQPLPRPLCGKMPEIVALLGKQATLPKLAEWMKTDVVTERVSVRHQFASAAREAPPPMLSAMITDAQWTPIVRLEMLRALGPRLHDVQVDATRVLDALLAGTPDMPTRYLALEPLAELAKSGDRGAATHFGALLAHDPEWPVRARAAELARDLPAVQSELVSAIDDAQPRVRQSALETIATLRVSPAAVLVEKHLESDPWTFVRVAAAHAIGAMGAARDLDKALADALGTDAAPQVRSAILDALASHHARAYAGAVRARLDDVQELPVVRTAAALALGAMCDPGQLERLTELARAAADPMASGEDLTLGLAAVTALGDLHPGDLPSRIAKLRDKSVRDAVRAAAEHALAAPSKCH